MKNKRFLKRLGILTLVLWMLPFFMVVSCEVPQHDVTKSIKNGDITYNVIEIDECEYILKYRDRGAMIAHKGNCANPIHQKDTVYIYGVQIRYGTRDTIFNMYPIDSAEIAIGYLRTNGVLKENKK